MSAPLQDKQNIDSSVVMSAEKKPPGTPSRGEIEAAEADTPTTPPPAMTAEEADAETPVMSAEAADAETPEPATPEPATTAPATLDALHNYLGPLSQALLGATPEALRRADASNIEWFAGQPAGSTLVCTTDENGAVAYHRGRSRSGASRYVVVASTAPLGPTISEGGLAADALSIVLSGTSADPINEAKGVVRAALAPLVAEVEDETSNVAAVKRRLGELESALSRCGHKGDAALVSLPLTPPPKIADLLSHMKSDEVADQVGEDSAIAVSYTHLTLPTILLV